MQINLKDLTKAIEEQTYLSDMETINIPKSPGARRSCVNTP